MIETLSVQEKYSRHWPLISIISIVMAVLLFIAYQATANVLLEGYLRLASFGFLALSILSFFKIRDGKVEIDMQLDDDGALTVEYSVRENVLMKETWAINEFAELMVDEMPNKSLYNDIMKNDRCVRFKRKSDEDWIYFNKINGRVIPFSKENAEKIYEFLKRISESS